MKCAVVEVPSIPHQAVRTRETRGRKLSSLETVQTTGGTGSTLTTDRGTVGLNSWMLIVAGTAEFAGSEALRHEGTRTASRTGNGNQHRGSVRMRLHFLPKCLAIFVREIG
jgi:hypothetical protein